MRPRRLTTPLAESTVDIATLRETLGRPSDARFGEDCRDSGGQRRVRSGMPVDPVGIGPS